MSRAKAIAHVAGLQIKYESAPGEPTDVRGVAAPLRHYLWVTGHRNLEHRFQVMASHDGRLAFASIADTIALADLTLVLAALATIEAELVDTIQKADERHARGGWASSRRRP